MSSSINRALRSQVANMHIVEDSDNSDFLHVCQLIEQKNGPAAQKIIEVALKQQPSWWQDGVNQAKLFIAAIKAKIPELLQLISIYKMRIDYKDQQGKTPLMYSAEAGLNSAVDEIFQAARDNHYPRILDDIDRSGRCAWQYLEKLGDTAFVSFATFYILSFYDRNKDEILGFKYDSKVCDAFIEKCYAIENLPKTQQPYWWNTRQKTTLLFFLLPYAEGPLNEHAYKLCLLLSHDVHCNVVNPFSTRPWTLLETCAEKSLLVLLESLLRHGADPTPKESGKIGVIARLHHSSPSFCAYLFKTYISAKQINDQNPVTMDIVRSRHLFIPCIDHLFCEKRGDEVAAIINLFTRAFFRVPSTWLENEEGYSKRRATLAYALFNGRQDIAKRIQPYTDFQFAIDKTHRWDTPQELAKLWCFLITDDTLGVCLRFVDKIDVLYTDEKRLTPLMHATAQGIGYRTALIIPLIQRGAKLCARDKNNILAVEYIMKRSDDREIPEIFKHIRLEETDTYELLLFLIKQNHPEVETLFTRLISAQQKPHWWNNHTTTELFFAAVQTLPLFAMKLLPYVDVQIIDVYNKKRTPLMLACRYNLGKEAVQLLLQRGSNLAHKDSQGVSALEYLIRTTAIHATDTTVRAFLVRCGIQESLLETMLSHAELLELLHPRSLTTAIIPVNTLAGIITRMLFNEKKEVQTYFASLLPLNRLEIIQRCNVITGNALRDELLDLAFQLDPSHFCLASGSSGVIPKVASMNVPKTLLSFFDAYVKEKSEPACAAIKKFANNIKNKTAFSGTPPPGKGLDDFYTHIENAVGNTIARLTQDIATLEKIKQFNKLIAEKNSAAIDLLEKIQLVFKEYIDATEYCGGKFLTIAEQQYSYVVQGKIVDTQTKIYSLLVDQRGQIATSLFSKDDQSVHAYTLFIRLFGKRYDLPSTAVFKDFDDVYSDAHRNQVRNAEALFLQAYCPTLIAKYLRDFLKENGPFRDDITTFLNELLSRKIDPTALRKHIASLSTFKAVQECIFKMYGFRPEESDCNSPQKLKQLLDSYDDFYKTLAIYQTAWRQARVEELMNEVRQICSSDSALTMEKKEQIVQKLSEKPLYMIVDTDDITSLEAVQTLLCNNKQLYMALSKENPKLFSLESLFVILIALRIVK